MNDFEVYKDTISRDQAQEVINVTDYNDRDNFFLDFEFLSGVNQDKSIIYANVTKHAIAKTQKTILLHITMMLLIY